MYLSKKKKIYKNLANTFKKYKKNKKVKNNKKRKSKKILKKNLRFAKGIEHEMLFFIQRMLNKTSKNSHAREFYEPGIIQKITSQYVTTAKRRSHLMKHYANHLKEKKVKLENLNKEINKNEDLLIKKRKELEKLNASGEDGPSRRTRSRGLYNKNTKIQELEREITDLTRSIESMKYILNNLTNPPAYLKNY